MIVSKNSNKIQTLQKEIDKHKNMLIIAEGATSHAMNQVMYYESPELVDQLYGVSELSNAFRQVKTMGVEYVFVINTRRKTDYIDIIDAIRHYDFTYIVPLGVNFSETFYNSTVSRPMTYAEFYLEGIGDYNKSLLIMTDSHASLYEDMDDFLNNMFSKINQFKSNAYKALRNGRNLCFVANNLENHKYSNLLVAAALCTSELKDYPEYDFGPAVFDIDDLDVPNAELVFFKNNQLKNTTIENLKNFRIERDAAKIITIDRVIKFIERELDFSGYKGKGFTEYVRVQLYKELGQFFRKIVGVAIRDYRINSVDFVRTSPGAGTVINDFDIVPINSTEEFNLIVEV